MAQVNLSAVRSGSTMAVTRDGAAHTLSGTVALHFDNSISKWDLHEGLKAARRVLMSDLMKVDVPADITSSGTQRA